MKTIKNILSRLFQAFNARKFDIVESWKDYDNDGNLIHLRNSRGYKCWYEYCKDGTIYFYNSDGFSSIRLRDKNNNITYTKNKNCGIWYDYNEKGQPVHFRNSGGFERWMEYNEDGELVYTKTENTKNGHNKHEEWKEYDDNGNLIHSHAKIVNELTGLYVYDEWMEYDTNNNLVHYRNSDGYECWYKYDERWNVTHYRNSDGFEYWKEYDEKDNEVYSMTKTPR